MRKIFCILFTFTVLALSVFADKSRFYKDGKVIDTMYVDSVDGLRVRDKPSLKSNRLCALTHRLPLKVVAIGQEETIDGITAPWVEILIPRYEWKDEKAEYGWAFGAYLSEKQPKYQIGDTGEGGGWVFFVSEEGFDVFDGKGGVKKCHYLEVSKEELGIMPICSCSIEPYCEPFTNWGLGYGKSNTQKIISAKHSGGKLTAKNSAAYACYDYKTPTTCAGEWFLPSFEELRYMYKNLSGTIEKNMTLNVNKEEGGAWHWSSSRDCHYHDFWSFDFSSGNFYGGVFFRTNCVRAVRAF